MKKNKTIVSLELPEETKIKLQAEADEKEMSMSALIRFIIKQYYNSINTNENKSK